jgi:hypothetical protein
MSSVSGRLRGRLGYANVVSTLALVFAMSGGALAASRYIITSTKQIKPSVLKHLRGATGPAGPAGPAGPTGAAGATGAQGIQGPAGTARAYGVVSSGGTLNSALSSGVESVTNPTTGVYCVSLKASIDPSTAVMIPSPNYRDDSTSTSTPGNVAHVEWDGYVQTASGSCPVGSLVVLTFELVTGSSGGLSYTEQGFEFVVP